MMVEKYMLTGILCTWTRIRISERKRGFEKRIQIHINKKNTWGLPSCHTKNYPRRVSIIVKNG